jgi:preprotein translocase subunit SecG
MILSIIMLLICVLLVLVVLIQNSKGGGIQSQFGAANQIMGVKRGTEVIEKATWVLAICMFMLSIVMAPKSGSSTVSDEDNASKLKNRASTAAPLPQQQRVPQQQNPNQP